MVFEWAADKAKEEERRLRRGGERRMNSAQGRSDANDYLEKRREERSWRARNATGIPTGRDGSEHFNCGRWTWKRRGRPILLASLGTAG